jgi:hypothetical protein
MPITDELKGIPMEDLIGAPLAASCIAQYNLAQNMIGFVNEIGFDDKGKTKTLQFELERPVDNGSGHIQTESVTVQAPVLGLVPLPALLIETVNVDFSMEINQSSKSTERNDKSVETTASFRGLFWRGSVTGKVSSSRENTRSTDNSAKYHVNVVARQQPYTEGMNKLMDVLASATSPIKTGAGS